MLRADDGCPTTEPQRLHAVLFSLVLDPDPGAALMAADGLLRTDGEPSEEEWRAIVQARIRGTRLEDAPGGRVPLVEAGLTLMLEAARKDPEAWLAAARSMPKNRDLLRTLVDALATGDVTTQERALEALASMRVLDATGVAVIEALARTSATSTVRRGAARALRGGLFGRQADYGAAAAALSRLALDAPADARFEAALAIESSDWRAAGRSLLEIVGEGLEEPDRSLALETLEGIASRWIPCPSARGIVQMSPGCSPDLTELLPEGRPRVRRRAAKAVAIATACPP